MEPKVGVITAPVAETAGVLGERFRTAIGRAVVLSQKGANFIAVLLDPTALLALVFGLWRLGVDLGWAGNFVIAQGLFSHWQIWIALAIGIKLSESLLKPAPRSKE